MIKYDVIKDLKPTAAYDYLYGLEKPAVKDLKMKDLIKLESLEKPITECFFSDLSPRGVYLFFDAEDRIRYIGQTHKSFYERILTQLDTTYYPVYAWNTLISIMGCRRLDKPHNELCEEDHEVDFQELCNYRLVMIDVGNEDDMKQSEIKKLESTLLKTVREMEGDDETMLLNNRIGELRGEDWNSTIDGIVRAS